MEMALLLLRQIGLMFVLICIGFIFYRKQLISDKGSEDLSRILLNLVVPVVIINNLWIERTAERTGELLQSSLLACICMAAALLVSKLVFGKKNDIAEFSSSFSNAAFMGIPLITAACGSEAIFYVSAFIVLINALQWTLGAVMLTGDRSLMKPAKVIRNPIVISVAVGLLLYILNLPKPVFVQNVFTTIIGMNTPLAMIVSGVFLANSDLMKIFGKKNIWLVSLIRLVVIPVLTLVLLKITPVGTQVMKTAVMICAACPVGSNVAVFARLYGKDDTEAVEYVCVTTILSLLTLPVAVMAVNML